MRILLVEDDETALEVFREALTEYEYEVVTARNGEDALQKARQQSFDLVVTDIRMPGTDGLQALEEVKALNPDTKSIVVTGYASEAETLKAMQIGVGEYLKKPFRLSELLQAVKRQLERTKVDERERARERALRATLMWALKMFLGESRLTRASWVQESGKWAITLGRQLGLPEEEVESLSLATILFALNKTAPDALPAFVSSSLPDSVKALLELGVEANVNPEARQVMEAAQRLAQSSVAPEQAREASDDYASRRGMLHVALSLEAAGDWENASVALAELSQSGVNREAVLASLGAGRVAWKSVRPTPWLARWAPWRRPKWWWKPVFCWLSSRPRKLAAGWPRARKFATAWGCPPASVWRPWPNLYSSKPFRWERACAKLTWP